MTAKLRLKIGVVLLAAVGIAVSVSVSRGADAPDPCAMAWQSALEDPGNSAEALAAEITDRDLLLATISISSGANPAHLSEPMQAALRRIARVDSSKDLKKPDVIARLQRALNRRMDQDELEEVSGQSIAGAASTLKAPDLARAEKRDRTDFHRGWAWFLLRDNDPAFQEPRYLARLARESGAGGKVLNGRRNQKYAAPWDLFTDAWKKIAPHDVDPKTIQFALTGTDANNMLYYIAARAARKRLQLDVPPMDAEILTFDGSYAGGSGRIGRIGLYNRDPATQDLRITSPDSPVWDPKSRVEVQRLEALEQKALQEIETRVANKDLPPIGGFLLEPILGARGVRFYRPEFLRKLRETCDRLQVPIFADEILTGGGRTGKFFGYEHYDGFKPDFVTFGKGLQVAGVAQTTRGKAAWGEMPYRNVTLTQYNEALLKSAQILNRIRTGKLMENAEKVGKYLVEKLLALSPRATPLSELEQAEIARGKGLLVYTRLELPNVRDAHGRLLAPMTVTEKEVDHAIGSLRLKLLPRDRLKNYTEQDGGPVKLRNGSIIEGSVDHGGMQPNYTIELEAPAMKAFLEKARGLGKADKPFWDRVASIASLVRQSAADGWEYHSPKYLKLTERYKAEAKDIPLHEYLENSCGVCRESAMLLHLALEAAGFDTRYVYVHSFEDGVYVEDHAVVMIKYNGEEWFVDSRSQELTGRRWADVTRRPNGIRLSDPQAPMPLPPYRYEPDGMRFEIAPYPRVLNPRD